MTMRVTQRMLTDGPIKDMTESLANYTDLLTKTSSGKKFNYASDDPPSAVSALTIRSTLSKQEAYIDTGNSNQLWMSATDSALEAMEQINTRSINLVEEGTSDTMGAEQRATIGKELDMILTQAIGVGNTEHLNQYIFSGFQTDTKPFDLVAGTYPVPPGTPDTVTYSGDTGKILRNIGPKQATTVNLSGDVFNGTGHDIFTAIINARDAMNANDRTGMETSLKELQTSLKSISSARTEFGARQRELQSSLDHMDTSKIQLSSLLSQKEDVNMAEAISNLTLQQNVYQTVIQVSNQAISLMDLFDRM
jgi:flagellar hook-associated protein 3 FlgL